MPKIVSAALKAKAKAWTFEAKAIGPEAKAIKMGFEAKAIGPEAKAIKMGFEAKAWPQGRHT